MRYFIEYTGPRGSLRFIGPTPEATTNDATSAHMFATQADAVSAFRAIPSWRKSDRLPGCKVRTRRLTTETRSAA